MPGVNITINGSLYAAVEEIHEKLKNLKVPLLAFGEYLKLVTREDRFDKEQTPDGRKWTINPGYAAWKAKKYGAQRKINELHGNMRDSIEAQVQGKDKLLFGTVIEYAAERQKVNPFLGLNEQDIEELKITIEEYLTGK